MPFGSKEVWLLKRLNICIGPRRKMPGGQFRNQQDPTYHRFKSANSINPSLEKSLSGTLLKKGFLGKELPRILFTVLSHPRLRGAATMG